MDLYRLYALSEGEQRCEGRKRPYIDELLKCAYPRTACRFEDYAQREPNMFFSRAELNDCFSLKLVNKLLNCGCEECNKAKDADMDDMSLSDKKKLVQNHPWILGLMIYLGKLHYIYYWLEWDFFDSNGVLKSGVPEDDRLRKQLNISEPDLSIFKQAYRRAVSMFSPMSFEIKDGETCPCRNWGPSDRLPYLNEEPIRTKGFYGVMKKVQILQEHLDKKTVALVEKRYPTSGINAGSDRQLLFALKSVKPNAKSPLKNMERNVLDMVSRIERPASDNMVTLLFAYKWKDQIHFLFPYIEWNLEDVLRLGKCPEDHSSKLGKDEKLPEHWLWREMKGVCCALNAFHTKMKNPFPDIEGVVIGLHFDLKPANILVTADGKLKITDFGQSIIQILKDGEEKTVPHNPGDCRYAAPESRPTLNYTKEGLGDIDVLLNYDVWSLGCIMVEVLIHMLDQQTLETFDQKLDEEKGEGKNVGFFTNNVLKPCVISSLESFQQKFVNGIQAGYMEAVTKLLRRMLSLDVTDRPFSWEVFKELQEEDEKLTNSLPDLDKIKPAVERYELSEGKGFREMGWDNGDSVVSFADMAGITLELVHQKNGRPENAAPCRIRLFRKLSRTTNVPVVCLVWGIEKGVDIDTHQRKFEASKTCFSPTFLFKNEATGNGRFECRLFPIKGSDLAFIFEFKSLEDVLAFQGTLLQRKILPHIRATVQGITPRKPSILSKKREPPEINDATTSHIQLWANSEPKYFEPAGSNANETKSIAPSMSSSSALVGPLEKEQCSTMVIFSEFRSPLIMPLSDGRKWFENAGRSQGRPCVKIVNRKSAGHDSYLVRQLPAQPVWKTQNLKEATHTSSSILLEADYGNIPKEEINDPFKIESMKIILGNSSDRDRLRRGTSKEWRVD